MAQVVMSRYGRTFADEVGIQLRKNVPSALFQLLFTALLLSARIRAVNALEAARALIESGLTTPEKMARASWQERVNIITSHGYKRYDERTATMLGDTADLLLHRYGGDLRELRNTAERNVRKEKTLLKQFSGIGEVGADIFLREVQLLWEEAYPYADGKVRLSAQRLGLPDAPERLAALVPRQDFARFASALIRVDLAKAWDGVLTEAAG